jgi:hypothetical protein
MEWNFAAFGMHFTVFRDGLLVLGGLFLAGLAIRALLRLIREFVR